MMFIQRGGKQMVEQTKQGVLGWGLVLPGLALILLVMLGWVVATYPTLPAWDESFLLRLHRYATPGLNQAVVWLTDFGTFWGVLPATLILSASAFGQQRWREGRFLLLAMAGSAGLNFLAKLLWRRVRPNLWEGVPFQPDYSFPSGHATYSLTFVLAIILLTWDSPQRLWIATLGGLFTVLVGFSRVYLGVHFPSDIMGGWLLAVAWTVALHRGMFRP